MDKEFSRPEQLVHTTNHQHCWHSISERMANSVGILGEYVCCHCGEHFAGREALLPIYSHGPFKPHEPPIHQP